MQPMMVINAEPGQLPDPAALLLARWAWRYRSELAPLAVMAALAGAAWQAHRAVPAWWPLILTCSAAASWLAARLGARLGLPTLAERIYVAGATVAAGGWLAAATAAGPSRPPLPQLLAIGGLVLAVPWWAHGRRRAKVRVERKLAAWPAIARDVGLPGSEVISAIVDLWGWRARLRLARGQTITDVTGKIPAIESGLGIFRGALRVYPTIDNLANRCELRVLNSDPHAGAIPWPATPVTSITQPVDLGPFEDAEPCRVLFLRRHALLAGTTGSGKSGGLNVLMANLSACADVVIWAIDLKQGMELAPWAACIDRLATTPGQAAALLRDATAILHARAQRLTAISRRTWEPSPDAPALVIIIDEYAELPPLRYPDTIARLGRSVAVTLVAATQRPTQRAMGDSAVRSQMDLRICFRVRERRDVDLVLGQGMAAAGWGRPQAERPRQVPDLRDRARHPPPRPRLPAHRRRRRRHRRPPRPLPAAAGRGLPRRASLLVPARHRRHASHSGNSARARRQQPRNPAVGRAVGRPRRGGVRARPGRADRDEPPLDLLPAAPARRRRPGDPDRARPVAGTARP
jgi:S-DNA-T family DNA segregation ATPase FtsK/SpoIIIE